MKNLLYLFSFVLLLFVGCTNTYASEYPQETATMAAIHTDSVSPLTGEVYITEIKGGELVTSNISVIDKNKVIGVYTKGENAYNVHQGSSGGQYYWRVSGKTGNPYKSYLNAEQKAKVDRSE